MVTLQAFKETTLDKVVMRLADDLIRGSFILSLLTFDDTMTNTGISSFSYGYFRKTKESGAAFRQVNGQYTESEAETKKCYADIAILGGAYKIDRSFIKAGHNGFLNQVELQNTEKIKAILAAFHNAFINGDSASTDITLKGFDGIKKILSTEDEKAQVFTANADLSVLANIKANAPVLVDDFERVIGALSRTPDLILCNADAKRRIVAVARELGSYQMKDTDFGKNVEYYGTSAIMDMGDKPGGGYVIPTAADGTTEVYFVCLDMGNVHGITFDGQLLDVVLPQFSTTPTEQLRGLVEMYAGIAMESTKGAAVLKGLKVKEATTEG